MKVKYVDSQYDNQHSSLEVKANLESIVDKIKIESDNIIELDKISNLIENSKIKLDRCGNLDLLNKMIDKDRIKIDCKSVAIDSDIDLNLRREAIAKFNLIQIDLVKQLKFKNRPGLESNDKQCILVQDKLNLDESINNKFNIDSNLTSKIDSKVSIKDSIEVKNKKVEVETFNILINSNLQVNIESTYVSKYILNDLSLIDCECIDIKSNSSVKSIDISKDEASENATFPILDENAPVEVDYDSFRHDELAGKVHNLDDSIDIEINSDLSNKIDDNLIDILININLHTDCSNAQFDDLITDYHLRSNILSDNDLNWSNKLSINLKIDILDSHSKLNNLDSDLIVEHIHVTYILSGYDKILLEGPPEKFAKDPPS